MPSSRKSPIKHKVRTYKKKDKIVNSYVRGQGSKSLPNLANPTIKSMTQTERLENFFDEASVKGFGNSDFNSYVYEGYSPKLEELRKKWGVKWSTLKDYMESDQ